MSDMDKTNDLDSYGVWVKQPAKEAAVDLPSDDDFDLPDFPETPLEADFDDIFDTNESAPETEVAEEPVADDVFDTELSIDSELSLDDFELDETLDEETPASTEEETTSETEDIIDFSTEITEDEISLDDFDLEDTPANEEPVTEETPVDEAPAEETVDITDDFLSETSVDDTNIEETPQEAAQEEVTEDFGLSDEDGEISLDEFMDGDFSDESVAAGNNGFSEEELAMQNASQTEEVSFEDGEISLDDFLDGGDFTMAPAEVEPPKEEIVDEKPLEMDISFDSSSAEVETEDNVEVDLNTLAAEQSSSEEDGVGGSDISGETEEIDLSDFGIDADAEETPINQDVDSAKAKDKVVDFDLAVGDEKTTTAPVVNEIKEDKSESPAAEATPAPQAVPAGAEVVPSDLLKQIIADLSGLRNEINTLKTNLEEMKNAPAPQAEPAFEETVEVPAEEPVVDIPVEQAPVEAFETEPAVEETPEISEPAIEETVDIPVEEPVIEDTIIEETSVDLPMEEPECVDVPEFEIEESTDNNAGFFGEDDGDDTIALSGNELDNIMSSVQFTEVDAEDVPSDEAISEEVVEEPAANEPVVEEIAEEPVVESTDEVTDTEVTEEDDITDAFVSKLNDDEFEADEEFEHNLSVEDDFPLAEAEIDDLSNFGTTEEEPVFEESLPADEPVIEDTEIDIPVEEPSSDSMGFFGEDDGDDTIALSGNELENILNTADFTSADEEINDEGIDFTPADTDSFEVNDTLEEPNLDDISIPETEDEEDELPEEIAIPKADDILVESSNTDFMDSVTESTEEAINDFDDFITQENSPSEITDETVDFLAEESVNDAEEFGDVDSIFEEDVPAAEEPAVEEPVVEETPVEEPVVEEVTEDTPVVEESEEPVFEETAVEEPMMDEPVMEEPFAAAPETPAPAAEEKSKVDGDLKNDIKSVLLYMDQLLENLPEEKIVEFAKSEEFSTYKKLFTELGLA